MKSQFASLIFVFLALTFRSKNYYVFYAFWAVLAGTTIFLLASRGGKFSGRKLNFFSRWIKYYGLLLFWILACTAFAHDSSQHLKYAVIFLGYGISSIFLCWEFMKLNSVRQANLIFQVMSWWTCAIIFLFMLHYTRIMAPAREDDFAGLLSDRNAFAVAAGFFSLFGLSVVKSLKNRNEQLLIYIMAVVNGGIIAATGSITGLMVYFIAWAPSLLERAISVKSLVAVIALLTIVWSNLDELAYRVDRFSQALSDDDTELLENESAFKRPYMIANGLRITSENPVFGVGFEAARNHYSWPNGDPGAHLHNNFLDISTSIGIPGLIIFYLPLLIIGHQAIFKKNNDLKEWGVSAVCGAAILLISVTYTWYIDFIPVLMFVFAGSHMRGRLRD